jgi:hypothetical protein
MKRSRVVPTIEEFCSDGKCTASTVDSSASYDDSSSTKWCRICYDSHRDNYCHNHSHNHNHSHIHSRRNSRRSRSLTSDDDDDNKARTLNCTELKKKLVRKHDHEALRNIRDRDLNSDKDSTTNTSGNNDRNTTTCSRNREGVAKSLRKNKAKNGIPGPWTTNGSNNNNNNNNNNIIYKNKNNNIYNKADGNVKMIGLPGIRSRWAWSDIETKTKSSPTVCSKGNFNGKGKNNSSNNTRDNNNTTIERSTPTAANHAGDDRDSSIHAKNNKRPVDFSMRNSLKALRDHCGKGSYWTEPTQRRRHVSPNMYSYQKKVGKRSQRTACCSKSSNEVLPDHNMDDGNSSSSSSSNTNNIQTSNKNTCRNREKEDAVPSSLMTRTGIARSRNTIRRVSNTDPTTRKIDDVTKITRNEGTERSRGSVESTTEAFDGGTGTSTTSTTTKLKAAATPIISAATDDYDWNHQKIVFRAMEGPNQPIVRYALDLISLVCNNSYSTTNNNNGSVKNCTLQHNGSKHCCCWPYQQVHRVLDKPPFGHTTETESEKERLMRLQVSYIALRCVALPLLVIDGNFGWFG